MAISTPTQAEEQKQRGTYRADRHRPRMDWKDVSARPERVKGTGGEKWVRNAADERALANGCWFDERAAAYVVEWFSKYLTHCQGEWTGKPFNLMDWQRDEIIYPLFGWMREDDRGRIVRRFRRTFIEVAKKNGKSTLASGVGLFMLVGEGMDGAEVYSVATDKDQASIVHSEAIRMVEASEKLRWFLKINYTTKHIYRHKNALVYKALSSRPAANEGLKGNCAIIDELHAWFGDELWNSLRYLGINWPEPLQFVITTAGNSTEHLCYRQLEYARSVEAGTIQDDQLLVCIHEAKPDEDITDVEVQRRANPSLGVTIGVADLNQQITEAAASPREMAVLKRYRFNIWGAAGSWIDGEDWKACYEDVSDDELKELPCVAGLDLARKADITALALVFSAADSFHVRVWAWLPRERAKLLRRFVDYQQWADDGWVTLTPGDVTDYRIVEDDIVEIFERYGVQRMAFDAKYAEELTQRIENESGTERVEFGQSMGNFAGPSARLEQLVVGHQIHHNGNGLLTWQVTNTTVKEDYDGNIRPVRPKLGDYRTIDAVVATVMALGIAAEHETLSFYDDHPLEIG